MLSTNRVRIFQKYILETAADAPTVKSLIPEHIYNNPQVFLIFTTPLNTFNQLFPQQKLKVYLE